MLKIGELSLACNVKYLHDSEKILLLNQALNQLKPSNCLIKRTQIVQQYVLRVTASHDILLNYLAYKTTNNIPIQDGSSKVQVLSS